MTSTRSPVLNEAAPVAVSDASRRRSSKWRKGLVYAALVVAALLSVSPFIWALLTAIKPYIDAFTYPPTWLFTPSIQPFLDLWQQTDFLSVAITTAIVAIATVVISLIVAAPAAYALARYTGRIGPWILVVALVFRALPRFAFALPFYDGARALGLYDTRTILIISLVAINQPFTLWLLNNFFASVPVALDESAMIDGCTRLQAFRRVILPLAVPGLYTAGIFTFLLAYQEYLLVIALTQTDAQTLAPFVASFSSAQDLSLFQAIAACSTVLTVPAILIAFFAQRYLVSGLTTGAVK